MFDIEYKGGNTVLFTTKKGKLVSDPKLSVVGLSDYSTKGAIEIATEARFAVGSEDATLVLEGPGEYEVGDFSIRGIAAIRHIDTPVDGKKSTIYRIEIGDVRIALLGNIDEKLEEEQLEEIGVVDILILPVGGGGYTLDPTSAASVVRRIDPKVVIPIHYEDDGVKYEVPQAELSVFISEMSAPVEAVSKYKVKSLSSIPQVLTVVGLTRS